MADNKEGFGNAFKREHRKTQTPFILIESPGKLFHYACSTANQKFLWVKLPCACLPEVYTRACTLRCGVSLSLSIKSERVVLVSPSAFTLHLPISILNDGLFLSSLWLMMSNPKILSNTVFVF